MTITCKLLLLVGMILAAMACTTSAVNAQETEVEVVDEATGNPCVNCPIHITGECHIFNNVGGMITTSCEDEFTGTINHNGTGTMTWAPSAHGAPGCNLSNCTGAEANWPISALGEIGNGVEHFTVRRCFNNGAANLHCNFEVRLDREDPANPEEPSYEERHYEYSTAQTCFGGATRIEGNWETEHPGNTTPEVEFIHHAEP